MSIEVKGQLAKLLATEDLLIEHRKVATASFDVKNRILTLPIWKDLSNDVYDLLVGHEVSHALYTPVEWHVDGIPQSYLNIVEDARVERKIKKLYPGLNRSFFNGYNELFKKDFFSVKNNDPNKLSLIDRINLHFKIGDYLMLNFNEKESEFVEMVAETETYADVIEVSKLIHKYTQENVEDKQEAPNNQSSASGSDSTSGDFSDDSSGEHQDTPETSSEQQEQTSAGDPTGDDENLPDASPEGGYSDGMTDKALSDNMKSLNDTTSRDVNYLTIPDYNLDSIIIDYTQVIKDFDAQWNHVQNVVAHTRTHYTEQITNYMENNLKKFRDSSIKTVNYLVKEFESKKAADGYARRAVSRTGVLDMSKLHTYKWNEDVFKKITTIPDAKNHGMIFFLDWSGSMANMLQDTAKQLLNLVWFCRKSGIPFEVYSFTEGMDYGDLLPGRRSINNPKNNDIFVSDTYCLVNWFSSRSNKAEFEKCVKYFWGQVSSDLYSCHKYGLGGTPLADTVLMTPAIIERFKKVNQVQKISCTYLSDGESCMIRSAIVRESAYHENDEGTNLRVFGRQVRQWDRTVLRSKNYTAEIDTSGCEITRSCLDYVKKLIPDVKLLGVRLIDRRSINWYLNCLGVYKTPHEIDSQWKKDKSMTVNDAGYDSVYMLPFDRTLGEDTEEIVVGDSASRAQLTKAFKKHMGSKMTNKKILTNFISQIA